ncbi:sulfatase family protein [Membranihabitans marinus]|uniref:sulfatase family protein n=1 Tax=Membranihabitans marinus TaxID=1227546 RepID=UPI001F1D2AD8|nr:sulfatase [Membranihabitans marinus]
MKYLGCIFAIVLLFSSCQEDDPVRRPNILLIVSEDNSSDLGCYGNSIVHTPNIDELAKQGMRFTNAYTTYAVCSPSRASIFTGLYPHQNGQLGWATQGYSMYEGMKVLPNYLNEAGYNTGCLGKIHVNPDSIFDFNLSELNTSNFAKKDLSAYAHEAKKFISNSRDQPYFLMVNFPDAHLPFQNDVDGLPSIKVDTSEITTTLPFVGVNTERLRKVTQKYYNCMNRLDESVGMLLDSIGDLSNTMVIYMSDHGAQFSRGKLTNYEGGLKIPFIVHWPDKYKFSNTVSHALISVIDLLPTFLDVAEQPIPEELPGMSLLTLLDEDGRDDHWRPYLAADGEGASPVMYYPRRSIRNRRYKLIHNIDVGRQDFPAYHTYASEKFYSGANYDEIQQAGADVQEMYKIWKNPPTYELYDLENDPWEWKNLSQDPKYSAVLQELLAAMIQWRKDSKDPFLDSDKLDRYTEEMNYINETYPNHTYKQNGITQLDYVNYLKIN